MTQSSDAIAARDAARYEALLDPGSAAALENNGALTVLEGRCLGRSVCIALTDRSVAGGSFGLDECDLLKAWLVRCRTDRTPVVFALDSGGARLTSGLVGLAAFRRMYRAALDLRLSGVPMVALIERDCFGGASMLAMLCVVRGAFPRARIGMSGPAIIEALSGKKDLVASDRSAIQALFGTAARLRAGAIDSVIEEPASRRDSLAKLLELAAGKRFDIGVQHQLLKQRLRDAGVNTAALNLDSAMQLFRRGTAVGAAEIWQLADAVLAAKDREAITIRVDCPGQAASRRDELLVLSEYVAHLALCLSFVSSHGVEIVTRIEGESAGGIYVALASGAVRVEATPDAIVRVLPAKAVHVVLGKTPPEETLRDALQTGVVDGLAAGANRLVPRQRS